MGKIKDFKMESALKKICNILILFCMSTTLNAAQEQLPPYLYQNVLRSNQFRILKKGVSSFLSSALMHGLLPLSVGNFVARKFYINKVDCHHQVPSYRYETREEGLRSCLIKTLPITVGGVLIAAKLWNVAVGNDTASDDLSTICKIPFKEGAYFVVRNKYLWNALSATFVHFYLPYYFKCRP